MRTGRKLIKSVYHYTSSSLSLNKGPKLKEVTNSVLTSGCVMVISLFPQVVLNYIFYILLFLEENRFLSSSVCCVNFKLPGLFKKNVYVYVSCSVMSDSL